MFRLTGSFSCSVTSSGEVQFRLYQQGGKEVITTTKGAKVNDGGESDVVVQLVDDKLQIWVDGKMLAESSATGIVGGATGYNSHNLVFGNPWGHANFAGDLSAFEVTVGADDFPARPTSAVLSSTSHASAAPAMLMATIVADKDTDGFEFDGASGLDAFAA